ncbi:MAG: hypothetical protein ABF535_05450 [Acetobacter sp.]
MATVAATAFSDPAYLFDQPGRRHAAHRGSAAAPPNAAGTTTPDTHDTVTLSAAATTALNAGPETRAATQDARTYAAVPASEKAPEHTSATSADDSVLANTPTSQDQSLTQVAMARLDQIIRSSHETARALAEQRLDSLKAQMVALLEMKGVLSPRAMAGEVALLARQLAAAVAQYVQAGGSAIGAAGTDTASPAQAANPETSAAETTQADRTDPSWQQASSSGIQTANAPVPGQPAAHPATTALENQDFSLTAKDMASQLLTLLRESRQHMQKQKSASDTDIMVGQNALETTLQLLPGI